MVERWIVVSTVPSPDMPFSYFAASLRRSGGAVTEQGAMLRCD
jgi:hypothetical protein